MKPNSWAIALTLLLLSWAITPLTALASTASDGEQNDWEISTADQLYAFAAYVNAGNTGANAKLMNDIVVNAQVFKDDNYTLTSDVASLRNWTPINGSIGVFDGQGHTISGLYCNHDENIDNTRDGHFGFFGLLSSGTVKNLGITNSYFRGFDYMGSFIAYTYSNDVSITNCWGISNFLVIHKNRGGGYIGGIVGYFNCNKSIVNCGFVGKLQNSGSMERIVAGGIGGTILNPIRNCYSDIITSFSDYGSFSYFGRLIGESANSTPYNNCYATKQGDNNKREYLLCYHLTGPREDEYPNPSGSVRTKEEFASGLVAYLLNDSESGKTDRWRQRIDGEDSQKDAYPVMASYATNNIIYACTDECPTETLVLSNSEVQPKTHNYQVDNTQSTKVSVPLYEMHCTNDGCHKEKPNTLVVKQCDGTNNLELVYETVNTSPDDRNAYPITINQEPTSCVFQTANDNFTIDSDKPYYSPVDFLVPGTLKFKRAFVTNTGYYTMFVPFKLPADVNTQLGSFFGCSGLKPNGDDYNLEYTTMSKPDAGNDIPAHTGCLFYPSKTFNEITTTANIVKASTAISNPSTTDGKNNNTMYGTYALTPIPKHVFGYYEKDGKSIFALSGDGARLKQFRAYLYISSSASSKEYEVVFLDNELSSIHESILPSTETYAPIYDLHGNIVLTPQRGNIYIRKGKPFRM